MIGICRRSGSKIAASLYAAAVFSVLEFPVVQKRCDQYDKTGACIVHQRAGRGGQYAQDGERYCTDIDAHGQGDAAADGTDCGV